MYFGYYISSLLIRYNRTMSIAIWFASNGRICYSYSFLLYVKIHDFCYYLCYCEGLFCLYTRTFIIGTDSSYWMANITT